MSVHYKFKAALEFSTITFDGIHISVADLKSAIIDQKKLAKNADSDLQITNAQTEEIYDDEATLIPKNTSVIVARVPSTERKKSNYAGGGFGGPPHLRHQNRPLPPIIQPSAIAKAKFQLHPSQNFISLLYLVSVLNFVILILSVYLSTHKHILHKTRLRISELSTFYDTITYYLDTMV